MCHVLVIEDDFLTADYLEDIVRRAGGTSVATAETEAGAIAAARRQKPDIILSDVRLACGTGPRAVEAIMAAAGPLPVIFITGTPEECTHCGAPAVVLGKPIQEKLVVEHFRRLAADALLPGA